LIYSLLPLAALLVFLRICWLAFCPSRHCHFISFSRAADIDAAAIDATLPLIIDITLRRHIIFIFAADIFIDDISILPPTPPFAFRLADFFFQRRARRRQMADYCRQRCLLPLRYAPLIAAYAFRYAAAYAAAPLTFAAFSRCFDSAGAVCLMIFSIFHFA